MNNIFDGETDLILVVWTWFIYLRRYAFMKSHICYLFVSRGAASLAFVAGVSASVAREKGGPVAVCMYMGTCTWVCVWLPQPRTTRWLSKIASFCRYGINVYLYVVYSRTGLGNGFIYRDLFTSNSAGKCRTLCEYNELNLKEPKATPNSRIRKIISDHLLQRKYVLN